VPESAVIAIESVILGYLIHQIHGFFTAAMPRRRKKKPVRILYQSHGPLPLRLAGQFEGRLLVFSDASRRRHGGLAAVLFPAAADQPLISTRTVPLAGSNELELQAALFGLATAQAHFPDQPLALFSDNQDAVIRLNQARSRGFVEDTALTGMFEAAGLATTLDQTAICWVKAHASCRGNTLADFHAAAAAN
jgi:ribonuclease HI